MFVCKCLSVNAHESDPASLIKCILRLVKVLQRGTPEPARKSCLTCCLAAACFCGCLLPVAHPVLSQITHNLLTMYS